MPSEFRGSFSADRHNVSGIRIGEHTRCARSRWTSFPSSGRSGIAIRSRPGRPLQLTASPPAGIQPNWPEQPAAGARIDCPRKLGRAARFPRTSACRACTPAPAPRTSGGRGTAVSSRSQRAEFFGPRPDSPWRSDRTGFIEKSCGPDRPLQKSGEIAANAAPRRWTSSSRRRSTDDSRAARVRHPRRA